LPTIYCSIVELSLQDSLYILFREIQSGRSVVMPQLYKSDLQIYIPIYSKGCYRNHSVSKSLHSHAQLCTVIAQLCTVMHSPCTVHAQLCTVLHSSAQLCTVCCYAVVPAWLLTVSKSHGVK